MNPQEIVKQLQELVKLANPTYKILYKIRYFEGVKNYRYDIDFLFQATCDAEAVLKLRNYIYDVSKGKEDEFEGMDEDDELPTIEEVVCHFFLNECLWLERVKVKEIRII